jgi:hypothetical protein
MPRTDSIDLHVRRLIELAAANVGIPVPSHYPTPAYDHAWAVYGLSGFPNTFSSDVREVLAGHAVAIVTFASAEHGEVLLFSVRDADTLRHLLDLRGVLGT